MSSNVRSPSPDAEILPQNRQFRGVTKDGAAVTGTLLNEDKYSIQILDSHDRLVSVQRANLREFSFTTDKSPMPSWKDKLTHQELADLVSYLFSHWAEPKSDEVVPAPAHSRRPAPARSGHLMTASLNANKEPRNWLTYSGTPLSQRHSLLGTRRSRPQT